MASSCCVNHKLFLGAELGLHDDLPPDPTQALALKFLYDAVNGAFDESVFTLPPCVAQSSAFQRLEYTLIAWLWGKGTPIDSKFLNSLIGVVSTENIVSGDSSSRVSRDKLQLHVNPPKEILVLGLKAGARGLVK